jgi:hypothetical protein
MDNASERCVVCGELPGVDFLHLWMATPNPLLGGLSPLQMLHAGRGEKLAQFIECAAEANYG